MYAGAASEHDQPRSPSPHSRWMAPPVDEGVTSQVLAMLGSWTTLDQSRLAFTRAAIGSRSVDWPAVRRWLDRIGLTDADGTQIVRSDRILARSAVTSAERAAAGRSLLDYWLLFPYEEFAVDAVRWAISCEEWESLGAIWVNHLVSHAAWREPAIVEQLAGLPADARAAAPILSIAWAHCRAELAGRASRASELRRHLISDATELHSGWRQAPTVDAAAQAGTIWMVVQRVTPAGAPGTALAAAATTQAAVAELMEGQRAAGWPPSRDVEAAFRAASAHAALSGGDYARTISEADYAMALSSRVGEMVAVGTGALARELAGWAEIRPEQRELDDWVLADCPLDLVGPDLTAGRLAAAMGALRELDREGCSQQLEAIGSLPSGSSRWTVLAFVSALKSALWDDPWEALRTLDAEVTRHSMVSVEAHEPLGSALVRRARSELLIRVGARSTAVQAADRIPNEMRWVARARALLWVGDLETSARIVEEGLFDPATSHIDRLALQVIQAAAVTLADHVPGEHESRAAEAVRECVDRRTVLPIALLPKPAVDALVRAFVATDPVLDVRGEELLARLAELEVGAGTFVGQVHLTRRERSLLPLLVGDEAVPEIAARLHLSPHTVRKQVVTLRQKYGAKNRSELVRLAREAGDL